MHAVRARVWAAVAAVAGFSAMPAGAAELGFYVGFLYGDASRDYDREKYSSLALDVYNNILDFSADERSFTTDSKGTSYGFLAGYRLTQHIAFEGGYLTLGKENYRERASGFFFPGEGEPIAENWDLSLTNRTSGFAISALGILPISYAWEVYARAGVFFGSNALSVFADNGEFRFNSKFTESSTDWLAGAGISVSLAEVYAIRAEFQRIFAAGAKVFGEQDEDVVSIGLTVAF